MKQARITLFAGHYGSGKTNIAVNYALQLRKSGLAVTVADLDIVNPYFRTKDSAPELEAAGVGLVVSPYANTNVELPALPPDLYAITHNRSLHWVLDVGGDDRGAFALGRLAPAILEENDFSMVLVVNAYRPLAKDLDDALGIITEIQQAAGLPVTELVNNSNLGAETTADTVLDSRSYAEALAARLGVPLSMTTVREDLYHALAGKIPDLLPLTLQKRDFF